MKKVVNILAIICLFLFTINVALSIVDGDWFSSAGWICAILWCGSYLVLLNE